MPTPTLYRIASTDPRDKPTIARLAPHELRGLRLAAGVALDVEKYLRGAAVVVTVTGRIVPRDEWLADIRSIRAPVVREEEE